MLNIKTFEGNNFLGTKYVHVKLLGFKFRVGFHMRTKLKKINTYATGRGRVFNLGRGYICFMRG